MLEHFDTVMSFAVVMLLLSLVVTTLVQMIIAGSGLRSSVLKGGLKRLLIQVFPTLSDADAAKIGKAVLQHPMIQHLNGRSATSIRKEELIRLLGDIANRSGVQGFTDTQLLTDAQAALKTVTQAVQTQEFADASEALKEALEKKFPAQVSQLHSLVDETLAGGRKLADEVGSWFDTVMDRTTENFLAKTRWITSGVASILAFALHVDSLKIIRQLASQPELRARLVQSADATLRKAEGTFALTAEEKSLGSASIAMVKADLGNSPDAQVIPGRFATADATIHLHRFCLSLAPVLS